MKNLKSIIAIIAISLATTFSTTASEKKPTKTTSNLRTKIVSMLGKKINLEIDRTTTAEISFMINNDNEVVVVSVDSNLSEFKSIVKNKLNYKKIAVAGTKKGEIYKVPVTLKVK
jgi:hypothetical protein